LRLLLEPCTYWRNIEVPAVLTHLRVEPGQKVLDIGSPKLPSLYVWKTLGAEVWATDLFPYFVDEYRHFSERLRAPSPCPAYHIEVQDATTLPYPDEYFDKVFSISVLEHIEGDGDTSAMREIARVLKQGGLCCLTFPFATRYSEESTTKTLYYKKPTDGKPVFFQRHYDEQTVQRRLVAPSGLRLLALELFGERWLPFERLYARLPGVLKIAVAPLGPLASFAFLHRLRPGSEAEPKAALVLLSKEPPPGGRP
jgi:ubiquinone/menaquinone biosynthesis C-methylase UbiE